MKRMIAVMLSLLLCSSCTAPAFALEYSLSGAEDYLFARATSVSTIYESESIRLNVDRSKNVVKIAPAFGSPTSYLPDSGEYLTPNLVPGALSGGLVTSLNSLNYGAFNASYGSISGSVSSSASMNISGDISGWTEVNSGEIAYPSIEGSMGSFSYETTPNTFVDSVIYTEVSSELYYSGNYLGVLKIPSVGVNAKIYEGTGTTPLAKGIGHFNDTSIWGGNVCLAGHNRGSNPVFGKIHTLSPGTEITLTTKLGTKTYAVTSVDKISETDNSNLTTTWESCLTLYTCVRDERPYRWCVRAIEI